MLDVWREKNCQKTKGGSRREGANKRKERKEEGVGEARKGKKKRLLAEEQDWTGPAFE